MTLEEGPAALRRALSAFEDGSLSEVELLDAMAESAEGQPPNAYLSTIPAQWRERFRDYVVAIAPPASRIAIGGATSRLTTQTIQALVQEMRLLGWGVV